jgi:hypothetical protein
MVFSVSFALVVFFYFVFVYLNQCGFVFGGFITETISDVLVYGVVIIVWHWSCRFGCG